MGSTCVDTLAYFHLLRTSLEAGFAEAAISEESFERGKYTDLKKVFLGRMKLHATRGPAVT